MSDEELKSIFARRLSFWLEVRNKTQKDLAEYMSVNESTVSRWIKGERTPKIDKLDQICNYLGILRSDLLEEKPLEECSDYYLNPQTRKIAQAAYDNPELQLLFDAAKDTDPEDIQFVIEMLEKMKR